MNDQPTIYIIDDDRVAMDSLEFALREFGYATKGYLSPVEFLDEFELPQTGCIIVDLQMPEMSGLELNSALKKSGNSLPIILVSGKADIALAADPAKQGFFSFLPKPINIKILQTMLDDALKQRSSS